MSRLSSLACWMLGGINLLLLPGSSYSPICPHIPSHSASTTPRQVRPTHQKLKVGQVGRMAFTALDIQPPPHANNRGGEREEGHLERNLQFGNSTAHPLFIFCLSAHKINAGSLFFLQNKPAHQNYPHRLHLNVAREVYPLLPTLNLKTLDLTPLSPRLLQATTL